MAGLERLWNDAAARPDDAIVTGATTLSYAALAALVRSRAGHLAAHGVAAGDVVAVSIADDVQRFVAALALLTLGARQITLATFDPPEARRELARRVGATVLLSTSDAYTLEGLRPLAWTSSDSRAAPPVRHGTIFLRTSGTTGTSNLLEFTVDQLALQAAANPGLATERLLCLAAVEHNNAMRHRLYCFLSGGTNVFRPDGALEVASFCARAAVTCLDISPYHAAGLVARDGVVGLGETTIRTSGAPTPFQLRRQITERLSRNLQIRYGATECGTATIAYADEHDPEESVGRPSTGVTLEIVGDDGTPCGPDEQGAIRIRAPGMAAGYFDSPEQTAQRFRDGWFWPGDIGHWRKDGGLVIDGRADDMMTLNGINIFPAEIERVLERHDAVNVAAAVALPSRLHGSIPVAAVELQPAATADVAELVAYARRHLALRAPRRIIIMPSLPRNSQGKILRREIAAAFEHRKAET